MNVCVYIHICVYIYIYIIEASFSLIVLIRTSVSKIFHSPWRVFFYREYIKQKILSQRDTKKVRIAMTPTKQDHFFM